ncbi:MAG: SDR family oxidoreductase [Actinobacteria bacterium]|nr:SDR family oxidoreductase [Actinomycetota bacterium]
MPTDWLNDRVGIVTGASRGIGRATALRLAERGVHVVAAARDNGALDGLREEIRSTGGHCTVAACDVADERDIDRMFRTTQDIGPPSILVCAAARLGKALFNDIETPDWKRTVAVNLTGAFLCCQRAFASMQESGGGRIITIASLSGIYATEKFPGLTAYNVSKSGVVGLTEAIAVEGRSHGISALCVSPGAVATQMLHEANPDLKPGLGPDDVGRLIVGLLDQDILPASGANIPLFSNL